MPLEDVSNDSSLIGWLRDSGHGHLFNEGRIRYATPTRSASASVLREVPANRSTYVASPSYTHADTYRHDSYGYQPRASHEISTPTQFIAPSAYHHQYDAELENLRRDPNTRVVHRPNYNDLVYKQRVFVKYLQPPTPPNGGTIIVREKQLPPPPPDPPIVIRRAPPPPPTPPPVVIRERPPPIPAPEPTMVINKYLPPLAKPPRQVIIEQLPQLPPKPRDVILERWLPQPARQRQVIYERLPPPPPPVANPPVVIQHAPPRVHLQRQIINQPGVHIPQSVCSTVPSASSLLTYDPYTALQPAYSSIAPTQSNLMVVSGSYNNAISSSLYGLPMSYVTQPQILTGLDAYGTGITTIPTYGQTYGQSAVYNVSENVPVDQVLRQLGVEPYSLQPAAGLHNIVPPVLNAGIASPYSYQSIPSMIESIGSPVHSYVDPSLSGTLQTIPYY